MSKSAASAQQPKVGVFEEALPGSLFERLVRAVRSIGNERLERNYTTTFWHSLGEAPKNVAEEAVVELTKLVDLPPQCVGIEWWLGRLVYGEKLRFHFDRDMTIRKQTGQYLHPLLGSILYLNSFPSSPTVILDQVPSPDGKSKVPPKPKFRTAIPPVSNRYMVFAGNLRHGVIPVSSARLDPKHAGQGASPRGAESSEVRLSLLVNFWDRRPKPPICFDYDGTIYGRLQDEDVFRVDAR